MPEAYASALRRLEAAGDEPRDLSVYFVEIFPVTGASVSTVGDFLGSETVSASDARAARLDELQFDLGEGPCWDAMRLQRPVLEPDIAERPQHIWPAFSPAVREHEVRSMFAFPLFVGSLRIGAIDMYSLQPVELQRGQAEQAAEMAKIVSRHVLRNALASIDVEAHPVSPYSRRLIHQATGKVLAQLELSADDARLVIQGHAFSSGRSMKDVAEDILEGRLTFALRETGIEVAP